MTRRTLPVSIARNNDLIHTSQVAIQRKNAGPLLRVSPPTVAVKSCGLEREVGSNLDIPRFPLSSRSAERPAIEIRVDAVQVHAVESVVEFEAQLQAHVLRDLGGFFPGGLRLCVTPVLGTA